MAQQPKLKKQLESELQVAQEAANKIAKELAEVQKKQDEKDAKLKADAEKRARKTHNTRKAEFENIKIDYEDVATSGDTKLVLQPRVAQMPPDPKPVPQQTPSSTPALKQVVNQSKTRRLLAWLNQKA